MPIKEWSAPLFERLSSQADEASSFDHNALIVSVRVELSRLLNTRNTPRIPGTPLTVLDYGISDWSALQSMRADDRRRLMRTLRAAIQHFEPRLQVRDVEVETMPHAPQQLLIRLSGHLRSGTRRLPAVFLLTPGNHGLEVHNERLD